MVMTVIKVKVGGCGIKYKDNNGMERHEFKRPEDGPFECEVEQAKRLVNLGVAEFVEPWIAPSDDEDAPSAQTGQASGHLDAEQLEAMDYNDIKKLAAEMGVKPEGKTKADYIAALVAVAVERAPADDEDEDAPPALGAVDPE